MAKGSVDVAAAVESASFGFVGVLLVQIFESNVPAVEDQQEFRAG